jgi:hypothetical protein
MHGGSAFATFLATIPFGPENWPKTLKALGDQAGRHEGSERGGHRARGQAQDRGRDHRRVTVEQISADDSSPLRVHSKQREDDGTDSTGRS